MGECRPVWARPLWRSCRNALNKQNYKSMKAPRCRLDTGPREPAQPNPKTTKQPSATSIECFLGDKKLRRYNGSGTENSKKKGKQYHNKEEKPRGCGGIDGRAQDCLEGDPRNREEKKVGGPGEKLGRRGFGRRRHFSTRDRNRTTGKSD